MNRSARKRKANRLITTRIGVKLLACVFSSLLIAMLLFAGLYYASGKIADYYSREHYAAQKLSEFQDYVSSEQIRSDNFSLVTSWLNKNDIKFMHIYRSQSDEMIFNSDDPVDDNYSYDEREANYYWSFKSVRFIKEVRFVRKESEAIPVPSEDAGSLEPTEGVATDKDDLQSSAADEQSDERSDEQSRVGDVQSLVPLLPGQNYAQEHKSEETFSFDDLYDKVVTYENLDVYLAVGTDMRLLIALMLASVLIALFVFAILVLRFARSRVMYIIQLSRDVADVEQGRFDKNITVKGHDEIANLALDVDNMRQSMVERLQSEKEAYDANRELITAMSHDIRTPLSALIGYLEIVESGVYASDEQKKNYIRKSVEKAYQLKSMSDKLFDYFTVFKEDSADTLHTEIFDGQELLMQMISEESYMLEEKGFVVSIDGFDQPSEYKLMLDSDILLRVFDNLFSNIVKYADKSEPIRISCEEDESTVRVSFTNKVNAESLKIASTRIGLKSCRRLMIRMGGALKTRGEHDTYSAAVVLRKYIEKEQ